MPLYLSPNYEKIAVSHNQAEMALLREFATNGYVVLNPDWSGFDLSAAQAQVESLYGQHPRVQDAWQQSDAVRSIAQHPQIAKVLRLLYGRDPFPFQTLNFSVGTEQKTHSDTVHFDSLPRGFMAGVWVALEDIDADNGPVKFYPGSHRLHHFDMSDFGARDSRRKRGVDPYKESYEAGIEKLVEDLHLEPVFAHLRRGQALIWAANLLHGGELIRDRTRTRHSQVTHYYFSDCTYLTPMGSDLLSGYTYFRRPWDIATGKKRVGMYGGYGVRAPKSLMHRIKRKAARVFGLF